MTLEFGEVHRDPSAESRRRQAGVREPVPVTLEDVRRFLPFVDDCICIYWSGSHVLGWNHEESDLDIYVVTANRVVPDADSMSAESWELDASVDPPKIRLLVGALGPFRSDVEFWLETQIDQVLARLPDPDSLEQFARLSEEDCSFLHKLQIARPLAGADWLARRQEQLQTSRLHRALARKAQFIADAYLEDVDGLVRSGDYESAVITAGRAFGFAVDAILAASGDICPEPKWRARRLERHAPPELDFATFWATVTMTTFAAEAPQTWAMVTARLTDRVLLALEERLSRGDTG